MRMMKENRVCEAVSCALSCVGVAVCSLWSVY